MKKQNTLGLIVFLVILISSVFTGCASAPKSYIITPESVNPVAISEMTANKNLAFFKYKKTQDAVKSTGLLGKLVNAASKKDDWYLYTDKLLEIIDVQQIVLEELAKFQEVSELIPLSKVKETKAYTSIRSEKSSSAVAVGDFKYLGDDEKKRPKKIASTEKVLREKLSANGYAYISVIFSYILEDEENVTDEHLGGFIKVDKGKKGKLHPLVCVEVQIMDKDGLNLSLPYTYDNGNAVKGYESPQEAKKAEDEFDIWSYSYIGRATGSDFVPLESDEYDAEAFYALFTADLVREAAHNASLRTKEN